VTKNKKAQNKLGFLRRDKSLEHVSSLTETTKIMRINIMLDIESKPSTHLYTWQKIKCYKISPLFSSGAGGFLRMCM